MTQTPADTASDMKRELRAIADQLEKLNTEATDLKTRRTLLLNAVAQTQAEYKQGTEVDIPYGYGRPPKMRRYRITEISGAASVRFPDSVETYYYGRQIRADGSLSPKATLVWPNEFKNVYPPAVLECSAKD